MNSLLFINHGLGKPLVIVTNGVKPVEKVIAYVLHKLTESLQPVVHASGMFKIDYRAYQFCFRVCDDLPVPFSRIIISRQRGWSEDDGIVRFLLFRLCCSANALNLIVTNH